MEYNVYYRWDMFLWNIRVELVILIRNYSGNVMSHIHGYSLPHVM